MVDNSVDDVIEVAKFDSAAESLLFRARGRDRAGVIAGVTGQLETQKLYVASIAFNLLSPEQNQYEMEILAKGDLADLRQVNGSIDSGEFWQTKATSEAAYIYWPTAYMFHIALNTPDREGLIAQISEIVGKSRATDSRGAGGSFVHLVGITYNSGGAEGGTAYFSMRANIAAREMEIQREIETHLQTWAQENDIEGDLWIRDLNP